MAAESVPEPARLAALVFGACPRERAAQLEADVRAALGTPPSAALLAEVLPAGAERVDWTVELLVSWLRVWEWSPALPAPVLAGPVLDAVNRLRLGGPPDPRTAPSWSRSGRPRCWMPRTWPRWPPSRGWRRPPPRWP
ncbi:hypothetical protein ACIPSJ_27335 [Streptomyces sp. NPDC090088]|uniref:hypothetical protein n=1 Tax=Streptomyces sp. NPDC090088 TaxID=3365944 RepID=UPI0038049123